MPAGLLDTWPVPLPDFETKSVKFVTPGGGVGVGVGVGVAAPPSNWAVTTLLELTEHWPRTYWSHPVIPPNVEPGLAVPFKKTPVPAGKVALQVPGQLMPGGSLV